MECLSSRSRTSVGTITLTLPCGPASCGRRASAAVTSSSDSQPRRQRQRGQPAQRGPERGRRDPWVRSGPAPAPTVQEVTHRRRRGVRAGWRSPGANVSRRDRSRPATVHRPSPNGAGRRRDTVDSSTPTAVTWLGCGAAGVEHVDRHHIDPRKVRRDVHGAAWRSAAFPTPARPSRRGRQERRLRRRLGAGQEGGGAQHEQGDRGLGEHAAPRQIQVVPAAQPPVVHQGQPAPSGDKRDLQQQGAPVRRAQRRVDGDDRRAREVEAGGHAQPQAGGRGPPKRRSTSADFPRDLLPRAPLSEAGGGPGT